MDYTKIFDPERTAANGAAAPAALMPVPGDRRDGEVYVYRDEIVLAVNVALATGRPLLLRGPSGSGKSSLAKHVARSLGWRYLEEVITSRTQARDLLWRFDSLRRLNDVQAHNRALRPDSAYVEPGVLWWAFDRHSAQRRGARDETAGVHPAADPATGRKVDSAVVLLDEIDKADPDVPNNLLVPIGSLAFPFTDTSAGEESLVAPSGVAPETGPPIIDGRQNPPLIIITTNDERELPNAFLRRCIILKLRPPGQKRLVEIAQQHFPGGDVKLFRKIAARITPASGDEDENEENEPRPSTAEYLDALRVCLRLRRDGGAAWTDLDKDPVWKEIESITLRKERQETSTGL